MRIDLFLYIKLILAILLFSTTNLYAEMQCDNRTYNHGDVYDPDNLFYIEKNGNTNTAFYDINLDPNGLINSEKPIDVYWKLLDEDGRRSEISFIERKLAFGLSEIEEIVPGKHYSVRVASMDRNIEVKHYDNCSWAEMVIDGKVSKVERVMLKIKKSIPFVTLVYMDMYGMDLEKKEEINAERWYHDEDIRYKNKDKPPL